MAVVEVSAAYDLGAMVHSTNAGPGARIRRIMLIALARKLAIALWRYVETGVLPEGARLSAKAT